MATVVFNFADWSALYPSFGITEAQATFSFTLATGMLDPTDCSAVNPDTYRTQLLYLLTAHIAQLMYGPDGKGGAMGSGGTLVGRVTSASEGSTSISVGDLGAEGAGAAWYQQTQYGALYWQLTAGYRTMHYFPGPQPVFDRIVPGFVGPFPPLRWPF